MERQHRRQSACSKSIGGPPAVTAFARALDDYVSARPTSDEPTLNTAIPGDPRDTTSPAAMAADLRSLILGETLSPAVWRRQLETWMAGNKVADKRLRAGLPADWAIADKTGTGDHGVANAIAILRPPGRPPLFVAVYFAESDARRTRETPCIATWRGRLSRRRESGTSSAAPPKGGRARSLTGRIALRPFLPLYDDVMIILAFRTRGGAADCREEPTRLRAAGDRAAISNPRSEMTSKRTLADEFLGWSKQRLEEIKAALAGLGDQADSLNAEARQQADLAIARIRAVRADIEAKISAMLPDSASAKTVSENAFADIAADWTEARAALREFFTAAAGQTTAVRKALGGVGRSRGRGEPAEFAATVNRSARGAHFVRGVRLQRGRQDPAHSRGRSRPSGVGGGDRGQRRLDRRHGSHSERLPRHPRDLLHAQPRQDLCVDARHRCGDGRLSDVSRRRLGRA